MELIPRHASVVQPLSLPLCLFMMSGCTWGLWDDSYDEDFHPNHCGDGVHEPDRQEECDDGSADNSDTEPDACRSNCRLPRCYDGVIDTGETCAHGTGRAPSCADFGYTRGVVRCTAECQLDESQCSQCGDGVAEGTVSFQALYEACDGGDLRALTCTSLGRLGGSLQCTSRCTIDTTGCFEPGAECGNGIPEDDEECDDGNVTSHDGCSSDCTLEAPRWVVDASQTSMPELVYYTVAYDRLRSRLVLHGVIQGYHPVATWERIDATWVEVATPNSPPAQLGGTMVYDTDRQRIVLWGDDLTMAWEYDGIDWLERPQSNVDELRGSGYLVVYDAGRQRTVAIRSVQTTGVSHVWETWEHDGVDWQRRSLSTAPTRRYRSALAYDEHRERVIFVSGEDGPLSTQLDPAHAAQTETWEYDGTGWVQTAVVTSPTLPDWNSGFRLVYDANHKRSVLLTTGSIHEAWEYDGVSWTETTPGPGSRNPEGGQLSFYGRALLYHPPTQGVLLFSESLGWLGRYRWDSD